MPSPLQDAAACVAALSLVGGGLWYASAWPESQLFGRVLIASKDSHEVALTFDDGPNEEVTPRLLDVLALYGVHATFFAIGAYAKESRGLLRRVIDEGHVVGNHTMHHPRLSYLPLAEVRRELADCNAAIEDVTGAPVKFFRPPFGARRPAVLRAARELGLTPVLWNVTGYDWNPIGADGILENLEFGIARNVRRGRGSNLLLHDGGHLAMGLPRMDTVRATERLLMEHRGTETRFVTVDAWA